MGYSNEKLAEIAAKLKAMPVVEKKKREHSKQDAVRVLAKEIAATQKRGYSLDQIAETLRGEGLDITTSSLKSHLQQIKAEKNTGQKVLHHKPQKEAQQAQQNRVAPEHEKSTDTDKSEPSSKVSFTPKPDSDDI